MGSAGMITLAVGLLISRRGQLSHFITDLGAKTASRTSRRTAIAEGASASGHNTRLRSGCSVMLPLAAEHRGRRFRLDGAENPKSHCREVDSLAVALRVQLGAVSVCRRPGSESISSGRGRSGAHIWTLITGLQM